MLTQILVGLLMVIVGFLMVWKPNWFVEMIGHQAWAEKVFGYGNDDTAVRMIGIIAIFLGFLTMTGLIGGLILWFFSPLFAFKNQ